MSHNPCPFTNTFVKSYLVEETLKRELDSYLKSLDTWTNLFFVVQIKVIEDWLK